MKKNIVFIPYIDMGDGRSSSYAYSIKSWEKFCERHNAEIIVWQDLIVPIEEMKITWQRYYLFDILDGNKIDYNQVLMVDADTIVHPDCPNFFNETNGKYCGVMNDGDYEWVLRSIKGFGDELFDGINDLYRYLPSWFSNPNKPIDDESNHMYGTFIFFQYIDEHLDYAKNYQPQ